MNTVAATSTTAELPLVDHSADFPHPEDDPAYRVFIDSLSYLPPEEIEVVREAYLFSEYAHRGQRRLSGEAYITHPPVSYTHLVHGNYYGTSRSGIETALHAGQDVILEIDWQGAQQVRRLFPAAIGVFILPPSVDELERRLCARATDTAGTIARRVAAAREEMRHVGEFDYVIINDDLQRALQDLLAVVVAARLCYADQRQRHSCLLYTSRCV